MSTGLEVADVFRRHGDAYRRAHDGHLGRVERRVMSAIELCRTAALGGHTEACADCGLVRCAYNSCRNRHCPKCQGQARAEWLAARQAQLLPVPYFHVVFTLPAPVAEIAFQNKATVYAILFRTAAETLQTIAADQPISAPRSALSRCSTPGARTCIIIRTFIASCPAAVPRPTTRAGSLVARGSSCRCASSRGCSAACFSTSCMPPLRLANLASSASSQRSRDPSPSPNASASFAASTGWSMPSHPSAVLRRCWPISADTHTASPSRTRAWSA